MSLTGLLNACAGDEGAVLVEHDASVPLTVDAAQADAASDGDAAPCTDCEYFPEECSADALCPNGPFGTNGGLDARTQINAIVGRSERDVWVAGALGAVAHFDGVSWTRSDIGQQKSVHALWLRDSAEVAVVSLTELYARGIEVPDAGAPSAGGWLPVEQTVHSWDYFSWKRALVSAFSAPGAAWLWGATENICESNGCAGNRTAGVWRVRASDSGTFELSDAIDWELCKEIWCGDMTSVHGSSANDLWAVGHAGAALHITNAESDTPDVRAFNSQTSDSLHGVWAASGSEAWAVGAKGIVRHYTGHSVTWDIVSDIPTVNDLHAIWGSSPSDIWAVGDAATVLHYDGKSWSRMKIAGLGTRRPKLTAVWMPSPGHVWIGGQGVVLSLGGKP
ncbi:hypothetical protein AKJ09_08004 [Labilithrix luteola]|uniref:Type IV fimbrial biogenesis protein PilY1 n=2 Tax=Labilithrix luteola TaxID=1391654 RepID=A0A0K1Q685_9BACT|nr:hypothetical protein AKJ09_08004 [Labilithrix luteola]